MKNTDRYTTFAIAMHWLVAALIFCTLPLGIYMHDLPLSPLKLQLISYHKWLGVTIFLLVLVRLTWRATHTPPALPDSMAVWKQRAAHGVHHLLYALMVFIPISGWLMSSATGFQTVWFGVIPLPDLIGKDKEFGQFLLELHQRLNFLLIALVGGHIVAALKHHFIAHDNILTHMIPFLRKSDS